MESAGILSSQARRLSHRDAEEDEQRIFNANDANNNTAEQLDAEPRASDAEQRAHQAEQQAIEANQRAYQAEQQAFEANLRALEAEKDAAREKKLRMNYYNQQCRLKKEWNRQKGHLRMQVSGLKGTIWDL